MLFLRSLVYFIISSLVLLIVFLLLLILFFTAVKTRYKIASLWAKVNIFLLRAVVKLDYNIIGLENIPKKPCVLLSNHQSSWDVFIFQVFLGQQTWVIKKQLLYIPFFGFGLALIKPIIIDRGNKLQAIKKVIIQGKNRLKKGIWVIIFPEGTRRKNSIGKYQSSGVMLAKSTNSNILPVYHNSGDFWQKGQFVKKSGTITMIIGKSINPSKLSTRELTKKIEQWAKDKEKEVLFHKKNNAIIYNTKGELNQ